MQVDAAIVKEQGVTFSVVAVKPNVLQSSSAIDEARRSFSNYFPAPIILMAQDLHGTPTYQGRNDIVNFLANLHISQIPWKRYTIN